MQDGEEQAPQETVENAKEMWDVLCRRPSAPMLELVMNCSDFAQTVENMFALSFLVRCAWSARENEREEGILVWEVVWSARES